MTCKQWMEKVFFLWEFVFVQHVQVLSCARLHLAVVGPRGPCVKSHTLRELPFNKNANNCLGGLLKKYL